MRRIMQTPRHPGHLRALTALVQAGVAVGAGRRVEHKVGGGGAAHVQAAAADHWALALGRLKLEVQLVVLARCRDGWVWEVGGAAGKQSGEGRGPGAARGTPPRWLPATLLR